MAVLLACGFLAGGLPTGQLLAQERAASAARVDPKQRVNIFNRRLEEQRRAKADDLPETRRQPTARGAGTEPLFELAAVLLTGNESIPADDLAASYAPFIGKSVSQADLVAITGAISDIYRARGYHLSRAIVPPQEIHGGRLLIQVIEGRIAELRVEGEGAAAYGGEARLAPILAETPARLFTLERHLLLFNDTPGLRILDTALEEVGEASGNFRLTVYVETWRFVATAALDNRGSREVGPLQFYAAPYLNSTFAPGDSFGINLATNPASTRELRFGRVIYDLPLGSAGTRVGASASYTDVHPDDARQTINGHVETVSLELRGTVNPLRSRVVSVWLDAIAAITDDTEQSDLGTHYDDYIRSFALSGRVQVNDPLGGANYLTAVLTYGLDVLGASMQGDARLSRRDASGSFSKLEVTYARDQKLFSGFSLFVSARAQLTADPLLASEEFYIGGVPYGRAFDGGELAGDTGLAGSAELRFGQDVDHRLLKSWQLYGFLDGGRVWDIRDGPNAAASLVSLGGGLRLAFADDMLLGIELAAPLEYRSPSNRDGDPRLFVTLAKTLKFCGECGAAAAPGEALLAPEP